MSRLREVIINVGVPLLVVTAIGTILLMAANAMKNLQQPAPAPQPEQRKPGSCPPNRGALVLDRSVYQEADNKGVLACYYELPKAQ